MLDNKNMLSDSALFQRYLKEMPIFNKLISEYDRDKPFKGLKIAIAHVIVPNTLPLIWCCIVGGAEVMVTDCVPSKIDDETERLLIESGIPFDKKFINASDYDYAIDCAAYFIDHPPKKGISEITRSGIHKYSEKLPSIPVFDCDNSKTKMIETFIGNPLAVKDAYTKYLTPIEELRDKIVVIIGFGKIGRGLARIYREYSKVLIVDINENTLEKAKSLGYQIFKLVDKDSNTQAVKDASVIFTATGHKSVITDNFNKIRGPVLLNIGAEDEFGDDYDQTEVFMSKSIPFNFNLTPPTGNIFIDPILALHIESIKFMIENPSDGLVTISDKLDNKFVNLFEKYNFNVKQLITEYFG